MGRSDYPNNLPPQEMESNPPHEDTKAKEFREKEPISNIKSLLERVWYAHHLGAAYRQRIYEEAVLEISALDPKTLSFEELLDVSEIHSNIEQLSATSSPNEEVPSTRVEWEQFDLELDRRYDLLAQEGKVEIRDKWTDKDTDDSKLASEMEVLDQVDDLVRSGYAAWSNHRDQFVIFKPGTSEHKVMSTYRSEYGPNRWNKYARERSDFRMSLRAQKPSVEGGAEQREPSADFQGLCQRTEAARQHYLNELDRDSFEKYKQLSREVATEMTHFNLEAMSFEELLNIRYIARFGVFEDEQVRTQWNRIDAEFVKRFDKFKAEGKAESKFVARPSDSDLSELHAAGYSWVRIVDKGFTFFKPGTFENKMVEAYNKRYLKLLGENEDTISTMRDW